MNSKILLLLILYIGSGIFQPIYLELIGEAGGSKNKQTFLYLLPNFVAMFIFFPAPSVIRYIRGKTKEETPLLVTIVNDAEVVPPPRKSPQSKLFWIAVVDVISQGLCFCGLLLAHSLIFTIIYSSCTIHTAWISRVILKKKLSSVQWTAVFIVTVGLAISTLGSSKKDDVEAFQVLLGSIFILVGAMTHSLTYVLYEVMMKGKAKLPSLVYVLILFLIFVVLIWVVAYDIPRWKELVLDPIYAAGSTGLHVLKLYGILTFLDAIHCGAFYMLIGSVGATTTGVTKVCEIFE
ncbi:hypothetical protein RCL1_006503 [Eukaryota sp. TZLM3-RCL]